jgi:hypothetical protein
LSVGPEIRVGAEAEPRRRRARRIGAQPTDDIRRRVA